MRPRPHTSSQLADRADPTRPRSQASATLATSSSSTASSRSGGTCTSSQTRSTPCLCSTPVRRPFLSISPLARRVRLLTLSLDSPADDCPDALPFTSILSLDVAAEAGCDPSRIVQLYGASKDFGANGLRAGVAVIQHNADLMAALAATAMEMRMGSPTVRPSHLSQRSEEHLERARACSVDDALTLSLSTRTGRPLVGPPHLARAPDLPLAQQGRPRPRVRVPHRLAPSARPPLHACARRPLSPRRLAPARRQGRVRRSRRGARRQVRKGGGVPRPDRRRRRVPGSGCVPLPLSAVAPCTSCLCVRLRLSLRSSWR
mgnify:CR=1 FL=1